MLLFRTDTELGAVEHAHESMIWSLAWHPFGHILVSGANDFATKFWTRNRPGDVLKDSVGSLGGDPLMQVAGLAHAVGDSELVEQLNNSADVLKSLADAVHGILDPSVDDKAFVISPDELTANVEIPGLNEGPVVDLNVDDTDDMEERDRSDVLKDSVGSLGGDPLMQVAGLAHAVGDSELVEQLNNSADVLKSLADAVHGILDPSVDDKAFVISPDELTANVEIPGLNEGPVVDLNVDDTDDMEERDRTTKWGPRSDNFVPHPAPNGSSSRPQVHHQYQEREPFSNHSHEPFNSNQQPHLSVRHADDYNRPGHQEDRDYRDFDDREPPSRPANEYFNRPGQHSNNYNSTKHPPDQSHAARRGDLPPMGDLHGRHFPPPPQSSFEHHHSYEHRPPEPYPPREPQYTYPPPPRPDNWSKPWAEPSHRPGDFGYMPPGRNAPPPPARPPNRFPPPPPAGHDMYRSPEAPPIHDAGYFPPQKRPAPLPPMHPEHSGKYPRPEPSWNGPKPW
ncbi:unnamed protein product [Echinostoma caproni]|uniref:WD_REPEATS_REGION domain-containing protein n=1 Tax=Echinostoma caproni TaxID=27848 RepID=A0A183AKW9_9TREM|nr:unnamed protein product [Echinostoma caproni]